MKYRSSRPSPWMLLAQAKRCAIVGLGLVYFGDILVNLACCGVLLESAWTPCLSKRSSKRLVGKGLGHFRHPRGPEPQCCLVRAKPTTGRYHQIRRHLRNISLPILGDSHLDRGVLVVF